MTKEQHKQRLLSVLKNTGEIKVSDICPRGKLTIVRDYEPAWEAFQEIYEEQR